MSQPSADMIVAAMVLPLAPLAMLSLAAISSSASRYVTSPQVDVERIAIACVLE